VTIGGASAGAATFTTLTATGNVTLGDAATDTVTITADVASSLIPSADNTYDLGASGSEWKDLYIDGTANIDSLVADTADINGGTIDGTVIGGSTPAAISGTTGSFSGDVSIADKIVHTGDTNTAIRFPAADTVTVETAGAERVRVDSSGNVGIGLTNPSSALHVYRTASDGIGTFQGLGTGFSGTGRGGVQLDVNGTGGWALLCDSTSGTRAFTISDNAGYGSSTVERLRITSAGSVGIGTATPLRTLDIVGGFAFTESGGAARSIHWGDTTNIYPVTITGNAQSGNGFLTFSTNTFGNGATERMRIDSSGNLLVGTSTTFTSEAQIHVPVAGATKGAWVSNTGTASSRLHMRFENPNGVVGSISTSASATAYNTSSDYRLKEDVQPMVGASDRLMALKPVNFAWKADGSRVDGFLAHEAQEVVPECVTGEKDAVDKDGKPQYQGIDQSKIVPLLTAALQEALQKIEALEARVAALEA
jgi:hypothetical protein